MDLHQSTSSHSQNEDIVGFSAAVRHGRHIYLSGTTADHEGKIVGVGDPYRQAVYIIEKIERYMQEFSATLADIVRTRIYIVDAQHWPAVARAHEQFFTDIRPANTMVVVSELIGQGYLVAIEAEAFLQHDPAQADDEEDEEDAQ